MTVPHSIILDVRFILFSQSFFHFYNFFLQIYDETFHKKLLRFILTQFCLKGIMSGFYHFDHFEIDKLLYSYGFMARVFQKTDEV